MSAQKSRSVWSGGTLLVFRNTFVGVALPDLPAFTWQSVGVESLLAGVGFVQRKDVLAACAIFLLCVEPVRRAIANRFIQAFGLCVGILAFRVNLATIHVTSVTAVFNEHDDPTTNGFVWLVNRVILRWINGVLHGHCLSLFRSFHSVMNIHDYNRSIP